MSYFIFSMPSDGLIEIPPVSKVTPFPISPRCAAPVAFSGLYCITMNAGGSALPCATPNSAPMPSCRMRSRSSTSNERPVPFAISRARSAIAVGVRIFGGSTEMSRDRFSASPITLPRPNAFSRPSPAADTAISTDATALPGSFLLFRRSGSQLPATTPVATAATFAAVAAPPSSANTADFTPFPFRNRTAADAIFRNPAASSFSGLPDPATSTRRARKPSTPCSSVNSSSFPEISPDSYNPARGFSRSARFSPSASSNISASVSTPASCGLPSVNSISIPSCERACVEL